MCTGLSSGRFLLAGCVLFLGLARSSAAAEDSPIPSSADGHQLSRVLHETLRDVHNRGADLYNVGDAAGCYRLLQGALLTARPLLAQFPEVQKSIDTGLANADTSPSLQQRAFALHTLIEEVRSKIKPGAEAAAGKGDLVAAAPKPEDDKKPVTETLWQRLGGEAKVRRIVEDWVALSASDPKVNLSRGGKFKLTEDKLAQLKSKLVAFFSQLTGGPIKYTGESMKKAHQGLHITNTEFTASLDDLRKALQGQGIKPAEAEDVLKLVETTRKDIVEPAKTEEKKAPIKEPINPKKPDEKKSGAEKVG